MVQPNKFQAVIFDIDGTIIDTERIQSESYLKVLSEHGITETELTTHGTVHIPGEETANTWYRLKIRHGIETEVSELAERKRQATIGALNETMDPMPGFLALVEDLRTNNIKIGLASSAKRERIELIVKGMGLDGLLDITVSADDVESTKPAPDPYLLAANLLKVAPEGCVVIEDAEVGIESGVAAGMKTVAVPNTYTKLMDFSKSDLQVESLSDLSYDTLLALVEQE